MTDLTPAADTGGDTGAAPTILDTGSAPAVVEPNVSQEPTNYFKSIPDDTNWRNDLVSIAGFEGDEAAKRNGQLDRVTDVGALVKNYFNAQDRIRAGEISNGLPENPNEEQLSEWRAANDVPLSPDGYDVKMDDGLVLGDDDLRIIDSIYPIAHELNVPASTMSALANAMIKGREFEQESRSQQDGVQTQQAVQQLKTAWGQDYQTNLNVVEGLTSQLPESVRDEFKQARLADGRAVFNSPEMMVFFADIARKLNPAATVVPNANNPVQAISDEINKLESRMGDKDWFKDNAAQSRLQELYTARESMKA
jgi:hypothetical protein